MNRLRTLIAALAVLAIASCSSTAINMPALTDTPTDARLPGKIVWHDLVTDTPEASQHFFNELFGWEFEQLGLDLGFFRTVNYTLIRHNGQLIGGMVDQTRLDARADISQWVVLLSVEDIEAATLALQNAGGTIFKPPTDLADRGTIAIVADPQGALLTLIETRTGDPLDSDDTSVGNFLWNELWTNDVDKATAFYQTIAPYQAENRQLKKPHSDHTYRLLSTNAKPRVGILPNPVEGLAPLWVSYIRVKDSAALDSIVARVEALGGSLLLAPQDRPSGGRVALIADPSGAGIALQTWPKASLQLTQEPNHE
ncbi:MAG: VOC family protein [Halopseudomonas sp.]